MATRYRGAIHRVLAQYTGTPGLPVAIDALISTAIENTKAEGRDLIAEQTCLGTLHDGPAKGLICRVCFDALESGKLPPDEADAPVKVSPEQAAKEGEIEAQVRAMIGSEE